MHLIVYDDRADIVFQKGDLNDKEALKALVRPIRTRGSTDISAGLQAALGCIRNSDTGTTSRTKRILLFSGCLLQC